MKQKPTQASKILWKTKEEIPDCSFCSRKAKFDSPTISGPWAYICSHHYKWHTTPGLLKLGFEFKVKREEAEK